MKTLLIVVAAIILLAIVAMAIFVFVVQNVETPAYQVVAQDGPFEIRDYPALVVAEVTRRGERREALSAGFSPLAGYIFAKERAGDRVAMTAPVTQQRAERIAMTAPVTQSQDADGEWVVQFIMPAGYKLDTLPAPATDEVRLREMPAQRRAVVRFSGRTTDDLIAAQETALRDWLKARDLRPLAAPVYAYYNDPFTPGFLRRNEILMDVADD
ncbi:SOUL family heme-binding protein [Thiobaca trueperi]|uniref:SOUL heme-binding protein n=1 Tax=Thiobaca trueperi TaxID=127458 RepID=A0A4R3N6T6_9GAMM|nr:heme-binding protein [Thiobaca trueperi]TCT23846.1 SOUL heme-binding protein [Thiobaca trueperi]